MYKQVKPLPAFDCLSFQRQNTTDNNANNASNTFKLNKMKKKVELPEHEQAHEVLEEIVQRSDLVPGIYEGGFKLWECSIDLIQYFVETNARFDGMRVLELGCGHGLPGIHYFLIFTYLCNRHLNIEVGCCSSVFSRFCKLVPYLFSSLERRSSYTTHNAKPTSKLLFRFHRTRI